MAREVSKSNLKEQIDENLRRAFGEFADDPVPDRFRELLDRLKRGQERDDRNGT